MIYIFSSKKAALARGLVQSGKKAWAEILPWIPGKLQVPEGIRILDSDQVYLDISGIPQAELKKALSDFKKIRAGDFWGIIDPKGAAVDPASFFFSGAGDYIGPGLFKEGPGKKRFADALLFAREGKSSGETGAARQSKGSGKKGGAGDGAEGPEKKPQVSRAAKFEGWESIRAGTTAPFFFLFVSLSGKQDLRSMAGEKAINLLKNRLRDFLQQGLREADALLWMESEDTSLFLIPPGLSNARAAVEASLKMILNGRFANVEKLGIPIPVDFTFALHYGETLFRTPGKTGGVISESVNYIFHLGTRKAEAGRLTVSGAVPDGALPQGLSDLFKSAGLFEGIPIRHSRRFIYK